MPIVEDFSIPQKEGKNIVPDFSLDFKEDDSEEVPMDYVAPESWMTVDSEGSDPVRAMDSDIPLPEGVDSTTAQNVHLADQRDRGIDPVNQRDPLTGVPGGGRIQLDPEEEALKANMSEYGRGKTGELPEPTSGMYDGLDEETQTRMYEAYLNHPDTYNSVGGASYKNSLIPVPRTKFSLAEFAPPGTQMVAGGINNAAKEGFLTAASMLDEAAEWSGLGNPNTTGWVDENWSEYNASGIGDELGSTMVQAGIGLLTGRKVANKAMKVNPDEVLRKGQRLVGYGLSAIGAGLTMPNDENTLVTGKRALLPIFEGAVSEDGSVSGEVMANKVNLAAESLVGGAIVDNTLTASGMVFNLINHTLIKPLGQFISPQRRQNEAVQLTVQLLGFDASDSANYDILINALKSGKDDVHRILAQLDAVGDINVPVSQKRTTMSAIGEGLQDPNVVPADAKLHTGVDKLGQRAMHMEKGVEKGELMDTALQAPTKMVNEASEEVATQMGGVTAANQGGREFGRLTQLDRAALVRPAKAIKKALKKAEADIQALLKKDPTFGPKLKELEDASGMSILAGKTVADAEDKIVNKMIAATSAAIDRKNAMYEAIPDAPADMDSILPLFAKLSGDDGGFMDLPENVVHQLTKLQQTGQMENMSYKDLHNKILPEVSKVLSHIYQSRNPNQRLIGSLEELRHNINVTQLESLENSGHTATVEAVKTAKSHYANVFAPLSTDPHLGKVFDIVNMARRNQSNAQPHTVRDTTLQVVQDTFNQDRRHAFEAVPKLLNPNDTKRAAADIGEDLSEISLGKVIQNISDKVMDNKKLSDITAKDIVGPLKEHLVILGDKAPAQTKRLEKFIKRVTKMKQGSRDMKDALKEAQKLADEEEAAYLSTALGDFVSQAPGTKALTTKGNGFAVMEEIFKKPEGAAMVRELLTRANKAGNKIAKKGVQAAYVTHLKKLIAQGNEGLNQKNLERILSDEDNLWAIGNEVFEGDSRLLDAYRGILRSALNEKTKRTGIHSISSDQNLKQDFGKATDFGITVTLGVLNRTAARARSAMGALGRFADPKQAHAALMDELYADPDFAIEALEQARPVVFGKPANKFWRLIARSAWRGGIYGREGGEDKDAFFRQALKEYLEDKQTQVFGE